MCSAGWEGVAWGYKNEGGMLNPWVLTSSFFPLTQPSPWQIQREIHPTTWNWPNLLQKSKARDHRHHQRSTNSGGECKLVLLYGFLHPGAQSGFLESSEERLLGAVVLHRCLLGLMVAAGPHCSDPQGGGELRKLDKLQNCQSHEC